MLDLNGIKHINKIFSKSSSFNNLLQNKQHPTINPTNEPIKKIDNSFTSNNSSNDTNPNQTNHKNPVEVSDDNKIVQKILNEIVNNYE